MWRKLQKGKKSNQICLFPFFNPVNWIKGNSKRIPFINLTNWWCDKTTWRFCVSSRSKMMHLFWFFPSPFFSLSLIQFYRLPLGVMSRACRRPPPSSFPSSFSPFFYFLFLWIDDDRKSVVYVRIGIRPSDQFGPSQGGNKRTRSHPAQTIESW